MRSSKTPTPRLARLAGPCASILAYRRLAVAAGEWPTEADNENQPPPLPARCADDLAGMQVERKLDSRPSLKFIEGLQRPDGSWDLGRLRFLKGADAPNLAERRKRGLFVGQLLHYLDDFGRWREPKEQFDGAKGGGRRKAENDNEPPAVDAKVKVEVRQRERFDGGTPPKFEWKPTNTTAAQRQAWRDEVNRVNCSGSVPLASACRANGLEPKDFAAGANPRFSLVWASRSPSQENDEHPAMKPAAQRDDPSKDDACQSLARIHDHIGFDNVVMLRHLSAAGTLADVGRLVTPNAAERWAGTIGERELVSIGATLTKAFVKIRREGLITAA